MPASPGARIGTDHFDLPCPQCGPRCRSVANQKRKVMRIWRLGRGVETFHCVRCGARGRLSERPPRELLPTKSGTQSGSVERRAQLAQTLWRSAASVGGTPAERYMKSWRSYGGGLPPTLRYLPVKGKYPHAMIAAFGLTPEIACGELDDPVAPLAVHLTHLAPDASRRLDKIMIGPVSGHPIVLAPVNIGLGLAIAEGIEDALSIHEATGLGAWAAGSATHMAKLAAAVPGYVASVTLAQDDDEAGRTATNKLGAALVARGFEVRVLSLAQAP